MQATNVKRLVLRSLLAAGLLLSHVVSAATFENLSAASARIAVRPPGHFFPPHRLPLRVGNRASVTPELTRTVRPHHRSRCGRQRLLIGLRQLRYPRESRSA